MGRPIFIFYHNSTQWTVPQVKMNLILLHYHNAIVSAERAIGDCNSLQWSMNTLIISSYYTASGLRWVAVSTVPSLRQLLHCGTTLNLNFSALCWGAACTVENRLIQCVVTWSMNRAATLSESLKDIKVRWPLAVTQESSEVITLSLNTCRTTCEDSWPVGLCYVITVIRLKYYLSILFHVRKDIRSIP